MTSTIAYATDTVAALVTRMADALSAVDGSFTFDPRTAAQVTSGYTVAVSPDAERYLTGKVTHEDISVFVWDHVSDVLRPGTLVSGWRHGDSGVVYLYLTRVVSSRTEAAHQARKHGNVVYTSLASGTAVRV